VGVGVTKSLTVAELKEWLEQFPPDAQVYSYEGIGAPEGSIVVANAEAELGSIPAPGSYPALDS
jgi:hypothetical protein